MVRKCWRMRTGLARVCQTTLSYPQGGLDTVDIAPLADVFDKTPVTTEAVSPNVQSGSGSYDYGTVLSEEGDISDSDDESIEDRERNSYVDWCNSAFRNGVSTFPSDVDDPQPMVLFRCWPIRLCRFMRKCLCWHCRFSRMRGYLWFPLLLIRLFDELRTD